MPASPQWLYAASLVSSSKRLCQHVIAEEPEHDSEDGKEDRQQEAAWRVDKRNDHAVQQRRRRLRWLRWHRSQRSSRSGAGAAGVRRREQEGLEADRRVLKSWARYKTHDFLKSAAETKTSARTRRSRSHTLRWEQRNWSARGEGAGEPVLPGTRAPLLLSAGTGWAGCGSRRRWSCRRRRAPRSARAP